MITKLFQFLLVNEPLSLIHHESSPNGLFKPFYATDSAYMGGLLVDIIFLGISFVISETMLTLNAVKIL